MSSDQEYVSDVIDFNPRRMIPRGQVAPFVEMAALPTNARDLLNIAEREFKGSGSKFKNGDTLLARITPCLENGKTARVNGLLEGQFAHGSTEFIVLGAKNPSDQDFIYYLARHPEFRSFAIARMEGTSGRQRVPWQAITEFPLPLPALSQRQKIGSLLAKFDDKIELNLRMNKTLEEMAQAIFKCWFIDFEPTRAKMAGENEESICNRLNIKPEILDFFPDNLIDSSLGPVPEGWVKQSLLSLGEYVNGAAFKKMHFVSPKQGLPVVKIAELKAGITAQTKFNATDLGDKFRISTGDILFSWSGNPDTSIDTFIWVRGDAWLNQHIFVVNENGQLSKATHYFLLKSFKPIFTEIARDKQTTGLGHVTRKDLERLEFALAPYELRQHFDRLVSPIFQKLVEIEIESIQLAHIRDTLLPKLLSGEIPVGDAVEHMEEA